MAGNHIESVLHEDREFAPPPHFQPHDGPATLAEYEALRAAAKADPEGFWAERATKLLSWAKPWTRVLNADTPPFFKWFEGGQLNVAHNCVDRHVAAGKGDKTAIIFEGEPGEHERISYAQLQERVARAANALKALGVQAGDRVVIYLPMIPEAAVAMLACARIGAIHSVIFGGFSAEAVKDRSNDAEAKLIITADGGYRRGIVVPLKRTVDEALKDGACPSVQKVLVVRRTGESVPMVAGRDLAWEEALASASPEAPAEPFDAEHPLFILYTSGSTGKPKGVQHSSAGYLLQAMQTCRWVLDLKEDDVYWCTADIGWVTGHSYVVYGPLAAGATVFMYEGAPNTPDPSRFWRMIAEHRVSIFYTAPTAIRAFMKWGDEHVTAHDRSSLRLLGTVGEPINPEAWMWYRQVVGESRCPIVDTWWQTETGGMMIAPFPGATPTKPGTATRPLPGIDVAIVDKHGKELERGQGGFLVVRQPWPGMLRTLFKDPDRYQQAYWSEIPGMYFTGDGAHQDAEGNFWIMGRVDDVINVSGHRLGTMEIESALVSHEAVVEAAVVGKPDDLKGQAVAAFVTLGPGHSASEDLKKALKAHVAQQIGALARPDEIRFADALPKTRSGKIMRRLLRDVAAGKVSTQDTTTLEDFSVLAKLASEEE